MTVQYTALSQLMLTEHHVTAQYCTVQAHRGSSLGKTVPIHIRLKFQTIPTVVTLRTVQYSTVQYSTVQYCAVQNSTLRFSTVQDSSVQGNTTQSVQHNDRAPFLARDKAKRQRQRHFCTSLLSGRCLPIINAGYHGYKFMRHWFRDSSSARGLSTGSTRGWSRSNVT